MLLDFGDARFAVVTTGFTMQAYRSPCIELYGTEGVLQMLGDDWAPEGYELWRNDARRVGAAPRDRPGVAVDRGAAPSRRVPRDRAPSRSPGRSTRSTRWRSCSRRRRRGPTAARAGSPARSPRRSSTASDRRPRPPRPRSAERGMSLTERPAPPASSPRPTFPGPALIRRADVTRHVWGDRPPARCSTGSTPRRSGCTCSSSASAGRRVPPLRGLPHRVRGRRGAARARGDARAGRPRDRRGAARGDGGERVLPPRHLAPRLRARAEPLRVLELFAPPPAAGASSAYARAPAAPRGSRYADDDASGTGPRRAARAAAAGLPPRRRPLAPRPRRAVRDPGQHGAPHRGHARARAGRDGGGPRARRRRGADGARRAAVGARVARRRRPRVRARARGRLLRAGRQPARVPQPGPGAVRAICGIAPRYLP